MIEAIKIFRTKACAVGFAKAHNGKISTSLGGKYFVKYDLDYCPCDTCKHMGEHGAVDPYGETYCPIDNECRNANCYEKKEGDAI